MWFTIKRQGWCGQKPSNLFVFLRERNSKSAGSREIQRDDLAAGVIFIIIGDI